MNNSTTGLIDTDEEIELPVSIDYRHRYLMMKDEVQICDVVAVIDGKTKTPKYIIIDQVEALIKKQFNADVDFLDKITLIFKS